MISTLFLSHDFAQHAKSHSIKSQISHFSLDTAVCGSSGGGGGRTFDASREQNAKKHSLSLFIFRLCVRTQTSGMGWEGVEK
jgi:hypothetical protein